MITISTEIIVLAVFLMANLAFGLYHARNVKTIEDYALGGRNFSTSALVSTIIATWIGGDYLFITVSEVYKTGIHYAIGCLGMVVCLLLNAYVFIPKMKDFLGNLSVAEAMGNLYGKEARIISAISGTFASAGFIAVQFKVFGEILKTFVGLSGNLPIVISAIIVIIYSTFGGIRSVTFTDVIQFFTFGVLIPVLGFIVWNDFNKIPDVSMAKALSTPIFDYENFLGFSNPKFWSLLLLLVLFSLPDLNPTIFQRVAMGRNIRQVKKAFSISAILLMFILLGMAWIGFLLYHINPNLDPNSLVQYIINEYSHPWLRSFILIGVIAMCMSSADSNINSSSVLITHDFLGPLNIKFGIPELSVSRVISIMLGICSIFFALLDYDLLPLVFMTQSFYIPIIDVPLMLAIIGFRTTKKSVFIGMFAGLVGVIVWRNFFMDITNVDSILPGMIVNFVFLMGSHYLLDQPGGWDNNDPEKKNSFNRNKSRVEQITNYVNSFSLLDFLRSSKPKNELSYTGLGIFCLISTFSSMYSIESSVYKDSIITLYESMLFISICFLTYPIWPQVIKSEFLSTIGWYFGILYLLIFCNTFVLFLNKFNHIQFTIFLLGMIVTTILTRWQIAGGLIWLGVYLAKSFYKSYANIETLDSVIGYNHFILYSFLLIGTVAIIFLRPQKRNEELSEFIKNYLDDENKQKQLALIKLSKHRDEFISKLDQECVRTFRLMHKQIHDLVDVLVNKNDSLTIEEIRNKESGFIKAAEKLKTGADYLNSIISSLKNNIKPKIDTVNLEDFINSVISDYNLIYSPALDTKLYIKTSIKEILIDKNLIKKIFFDIFNFISKSTNYNYISITIDDSKIEYETEDNPFKIVRSAIRFSVNTNLKYTSQLVDEFFNHDSNRSSEILKIISSHYGEIKTVNNDDYIFCEINLPVNIKEIRPKKIDLLDEQITKIEELNNLITERNKEFLYKIAIELIKADLDFVLISKITKLDLDTISDLSDYIEGKKI